VKARPNQLSILKAGLYDDVVTLVEISRLASQIEEDVGAETSYNLGWANASQAFIGTRLFVTWIDSST